MVVTSDAAGAVGSLIHAAIELPNVRSSDVLETCDPSYNAASNLEVQAIARLDTGSSSTVRRGLQGDCTYVPGDSVEQDVTLRIGDSYPLELRLYIRGGTPGGCNIEALQEFKVRTSSTMAFGGLSNITDLQGGPVSGIHLIEQETGTDYVNGITLPPGCSNSFDDDMSGAADFPADTGCKNTADNSERSSSGLGAEVAGALGLIHMAHRRTSRKSRSL